MWRPGGSSAETVIRAGALPKVEVRIRGSGARTRQVYLSAARRHGESARFRPGGVVDPDTGCRLVGPRGTDLD
jgi:hypothetical protein